MRELARSIRDGTYAPQAGRHVSIPKPNGRPRILTLRNICDRVVSSALNVALVPLWEELFLPSSYGFRPRKNVWQLLAALEADMIASDQWVVALDDVRNAFDSSTVTVFRGRIYYPFGTRS